MEFNEVLKSVCFYTEDEQMGKLCDYIEKCDDKYSISKPDFILTERNQLIWELLVIAYGDYGTSPRSGWLSIENKKEILEILKDEDLE